MSSDNETACIVDPNFAVICAFLQKFGTLCGLSCIDFIDLQKMIENTQELPQPLVDLHLKLLRRIKKTVPIERWERVLAKVCHSYNKQDGWEIERFGYKDARVSCKLRTLKTLLEMQFDCPTQFKNEVNKLSADELRSQPLGRDKLGHAYWSQIDEDCQIRIYKEDLDETWMLIAQDRDDLLSLISQLKENDSIMTGIEPVLNEDSNSLEIEKSILDMGQTDSSSNQPTADDKTEEKVADESNGVVESDEEEPEVKKEHPPARRISLRLKPMSELLNSLSAAEYQAEEEAKKKRTNEETVENSKPAKARKLTVMNSKPIKLTNKKHVEESSEEEGDVDEEDKEDMEDSEDVGEEIVERIMYVKGRGQGKDNYTANIRQGSEESSPIVGEEIREENPEVAEDEEDGLEEEDSAKPQVKDVKRSIVIAVSTKINKAVDKKTTTSFSMEFNSFNLPPMLQKKLKKRQMMKQKQLKKQTADDSNEVDDDEEEDGEEELPKSIPKGKAGNLKGIRPPVKNIVRLPGKSAPPPVQIKKSTTSNLTKERKKKKTESNILQEIVEQSSPILGVRQSRRIVKIKIGEIKKPKLKSESKKMFVKAKKHKNGKLTTDKEQVPVKKKKKKNHKKKQWETSSDSSLSLKEEQEDGKEEISEDDITEDEMRTYHDFRTRELISDHEFSLESDLEDGAEVIPLKRARTVRKEDKSEDDGEEELNNTTNCVKCAKFNHPEWILLCDRCDHGWHCSCLRPALLVIPEGDWFCPPCQHAMLLTKLEELLVDLDKRRSKQQIEVRRQAQLAYFSINSHNVLAAKKDNKKGDKRNRYRDRRNRKRDSSSTDSSDSDQHIYQLRQRQQSRNYRFNDYDALINSAIQDEEDPEDEEEAVEGRRKDIATIVNAEKEQREKEEGIGDTADKPSDKEIIKRKKKLKLNSLLFSSGEDGTSDEDFRENSTDEDKDDLEFNDPLSSNDSAIGRRRKKGGEGTRRSTRTRWTKMDEDLQLPTDLSIKRDTTATNVKHKEPFDLEKQLVGTAAVKPSCANIDPKMMMKRLYIKVIRMPK